MAEYQQREANYSNLMQNQIAAFCEAVAMGNSHLEDIAEHHFQACFEGDNFNIDLAMSVLGVDPGLRFSADLPRILARKLGPFLMKEAEIEGHMDVSASTTDSTTKKAESEISGKGKIGYGPVSIGVSIHGKAGVESSRKRASDYRAGVKWRVLMERLDPPEAILRIVDALCHFIDATTDINVELATARAEQIKTQLIGGGADTDAGNAESGDSNSDL
jgi:hypothetical protein